MTITTEMFVPVTDNEGQPFEEAQHWRPLHERLASALGGFHQDREAPGGWRSPSGTIYYETSRVYVVELSSWQKVPAFLEVVEWTRVRFGQEQMFVRIAGHGEMLGPP